jgi:hypothetical protein
MSELHSYTRERLIDQAVAAGKFSEERRSHYAEMYDRDPLAAAATIGALAVPVRVPGQAPHVNPVVPVEANQATSEQVQAWTDQLFPEARLSRVVEAQVQATGPSAYPRVMSAGDDS